MKLYTFWISLVCEGWIDIIISFFVRKGFTVSMHDNKMPDLPKDKIYGSYLLVLELKTEDSGINSLTVKAFNHEIHTFLESKNIHYYFLMTMRDGNWNSFNTNIILDKVKLKPKSNLLKLVSTNPTVDEKKEL